MCVCVCALFPYFLPPCYGFTRQFTASNCVSFSWNKRNPAFANRLLVLVHTFTYRACAACMIRIKPFLMSTNQLWMSIRIRLVMSELGMSPEIPGHQTQTWKPSYLDPDRWRCVDLPSLLWPQASYMLREKHKATHSCTLACKGLPLQHEHSFKPGLSYTQLGYCQWIYTDTKAPANLGPPP